MQAMTFIINKCVYGGGGGGHSFTHFFKWEVLGKFDKLQAVAGYLFFNHLSTTGLCSGPAHYDT